MNAEAINLFWFRRDLRLSDNHGLYQALKKGVVHPIFIFDKNILDDLEDKADRRLSFIHRELGALRKSLREMDSDLDVHYGEPKEILADILRKHRVQAVYSNWDYEPYALKRDAEIAKLCGEQGVGFLQFKDQAILDKDEVLKDDGKPYTVFTPYMRKWKQRLTPDHLRQFPTEQYFHNFRKFSSKNFPELEFMGFAENLSHIPSKEIEEHIINSYHLQRDIPSLKGTSRLSIHLRFGTISIRKLAKRAMALNEKFLNELIWRDFYMMILWHFPNVAYEAFNSKYRAIQWLHDDEALEAWKQGKTGYPIVDAGMRELNETGFMHNRVRMIVASFFTKHLFMNWQIGEAYFAQKLNDFELSSNNGGWQWAASTGVDAAPYFRVFNPELQTKKFDPELKYIKKWVPEFQEFDYPKPIVEHKFARERALQLFKEQLR